VKALAAVPTVIMATMRLFPVVVCNLPVAGCWVQVTDRLKYEGLRNRVQEGIRQALISEGALASNV
jgi:hypothetical protein